MHSRAAKRAVSPTNESLLKFVPRTEPIPTVKPHILSAKHNAGITKKSKSKQITRAQRKRQEKGLERAELIMDRTEKKMAKSMGKAKVVKERRVRIFLPFPVLFYYLVVNKTNGHPVHVG